VHKLTLLSLTVTAVMNVVRLIRPEVICRFLLLMQLYVVHI